MTCFEIIKLVLYNKLEYKEVSRDGYMEDYILYEDDDDISLSGIIKKWRNSFN
jgi:hypothetical protein